jgi:hypothetical protein
MKQAYPFLPDDEPDKESFELKRRTKVAAAAVLTSLELGDMVYSAVTGGLHDLKLIVTVALWLVLAVIWYWILRDRKTR